MVGNRVLRSPPPKALLLTPSLSVRHSLCQFLFVNLLVCPEYACPSHHDTVSMISLDPPLSFFVTSLDRTLLPIQCIPIPDQVKSRDNWVRESKTFQSIVWRERSKAPLQRAALGITLYGTYYYHSFQKMAVWTSQSSHLKNMLRW